MTSDLYIPTLDGVGIAATSGNVRIDVGGHVVHGPNTCSGPVTPENCLYGGGAGVALKVDSQIENGGIVETGGTGATVGSRSQVTNVYARSDGFSGFAMADNCTGSKIRAYSNTYHGAQLGSGSRCTQCVAKNNEKIGFYVEGGVIERSSSIGNSGYGIALQSAGQVLNSVISGSDVGIYVNAGGALIYDNTFSANANFGIQFFETQGQEKTSIRGNTLIDNNGGSANLQIGGDNWIQLGPNLCGSKVCP